MKTILIVNDNSPESRHAAEFALALAQKVKANLMLANTSTTINKVIKKIPVGAMVRANYGIGRNELPVSEMHYYLRSLSVGHAGFKPEIEEFEISDKTETEVISMINRSNIWLMVKGMGDKKPVLDTKKSINIHAVLNGVLCPLLLVPAQWQIKDIERLSYLADLRYCRIQIVRYLAELARPWNAALSIAHRSANGLPDMAEKYALAVFSEEVSHNVDYDELFFNNIKEKDLAKVVDVLINGMHNDLLVLVNHRFHFEEIVGRYITDTLPLNITIPLLIFPY
jgi:Universal stress protein family